MIKENSKAEPSTEAGNIAKPLLAVRASLPCNCTKTEALKYYGFIEVGRKSIRGNMYSKCWYNEKLNVFAVPFWWRTSYLKFMSRDKKIQDSIYKHPSDMWYGKDIVRSFEKLSNLLSNTA